MRKISSTLLSAAVIGLAASAASAADLPRKAPAVVPPAPPPFSWTGFYIGGHGGCAQTRSDYAQGPFTDSDPGAGSSFSIDTANGGGCYGGVQVGYNYQFAPNWMVGVEADGSWGSIKSNTQLLETETTEIEAIGQYNQKLTSFGTVRGRAGYTWNWGTAPALFYVTGGWAWARNQLFSQAAESVTINNVTALPGAVTDTQTHSGWTVGTGLEVALGSNWSVKGEYLYMNLGSKTYATSLITDDGALPGSTSANGNLKIQTVRVGLNYRFGWGPFAAR